MCGNRSRSFSISIRHFTSHQLLTDRHHILFLGKVQQTLHIDALGSLNGKAEGTAPNQLRKWSQSAADAKGDGVIKWLLEAVVVEEHAGRGVDIWMRVFSLFFGIS